jgi:hypothetical protein
MSRGKRYQPEQVVNLLREIVVAVANGKTTAQACQEAEIVEQTYYRWRKEYGGLQVDQAKRLKEVESRFPALFSEFDREDRFHPESRSLETGCHDLWEPTYKSYRSNHWVLQPNSNPP